MNELIALAFRISIMYLYVLALLRLTGKRSIGEISAFDFVIANMIGDFFDDIFWMEVPLAKGLVAVTTLILLHSLVAYASYKNARIHNLVASKQTAVIHLGKLVPEGMREQRTPEEEILSQMRLQKEDKVGEIRHGFWEPSGHLSLLRKEEAKKAQKSDLPRLKEKVS